MTNKKPDKNVAGMAVLQDIRSLLSSSHDTKTNSPAETKTGTVLRHQKDKDIKELKQYQETITQQQNRIVQLETEKKELSGKLALLQASSGGSSDGDKHLTADIAGMEAGKEELTRALAQIEELLQLKTKDLVRRIRRIYEEAGDFEAGRDFRRISNQLEAAENFGEFLRALLRD